MVKCDRSCPPPPSLSKRQSYNEEDVIKALKAVFHDKCYICELKKLQDGIVEHRIPHKGDDALKYDWDNLFWACHHCNTWKNQQDFEYNVIDCCKEDPERHLKLIYDPQSSMIVVKPKDDELPSVKTADLLKNVFNTANTGIRTNGRSQRMMALKEEWDIFMQLLEKYRYKKTGYSRKQIISRLRRESAFAAVKREYIREHCKEYQEFQEFVAIKQGNEGEE